MKRTNQLFFAFQIVLIFTFFFVDDSFAQQQILDEIADENEDGPFSGIFGAIILFGLIWLIGTILDKKESSNNYSYKQSLHTKSTQSNCATDNASVDDEKKDSFKEGINASSKKCINIDEDIKESTKHKEDFLRERIFKDKCIDIYGDYAECTYKMVLIKEDGEYCQISDSDKRYNILSEYIFLNHRERYYVSRHMGCGEQLRCYIEFVKKGKLFPEAKPMESHGKLEKEYYGERIALMKSFYDESLQQDPACSNSGELHNSFCIILGWDLAIYIHKYIKQPMDVLIYRNLKEMKFREMSSMEFLNLLAKRKKRAMVISADKKGIYDEANNYLGDTYEEACEALEREELISVHQAIREVKNIEWRL